jgi:hypothetical protein
MKKGILSEVSTVTKGENPSSPPPLYPLHYRLISECKMKPSPNLQYRVKDLRFDNIVIFLIKNQASYLSDSDVDNIRKISKMHCDMVDDVLRLRLDAAATSSKQNCFFMTDGSEMPWADE